MDLRACGTIANSSGHISIVCFPDRRIDTLRLKIENKKNVEIFYLVLRGRSGNLSAVIVQCPFSIDRMRDGIRIYFFDI